MHSGEQLLRALQREELGPFCEQVLILTSPNPHNTPAAFIVTRSSQPEAAAFPGSLSLGKRCHPPQLCDFGPASLGCRRRAKGSLLASPTLMSKKIQIILYLLPLLRPSHRALKVGMPQGLEAH